MAYGAIAANALLHLATMLLGWLDLTKATRDKVPGPDLMSKG